MPASLSAHWHLWLQPLHHLYCLRQCHWNWKFPSQCRVPLVHQAGLWPHSHPPSHQMSLSAAANTPGSSRDHLERKCFMQNLQQCTRVRVTLHAWHRLWHVISVLLSCHAMNELFRHITLSWVTRGECNMSTKGTWCDNTMLMTWLDDNHRNCYWVTLMWAGNNWN